MTRQLIADSWVAIRAQFDDDDLDTVFRLRTQMPSRHVRHRYRTMTILKWQYAPKKDGMPRQADIARRSRFEDALENAVEAPDLGLQAATLTGNGRRTWRYFVADPARFAQVIQPLVHAHGPEPFLFKQVEDPAWEGLAE